MATTPAWDRAAALVPVDGRRRPEVLALPVGLPTVAQLFDFMRDAELRFATLRLRVEEQARTARGEETTTSEVALRHPGQAKVTTTREARAGRADYDIWISDGDLVRTYAAAHKLGTQRPARNRPRGLHDRDFPGSSQVYEPITALPTETLPETFIHPAGYCQNVLATGRCTVIGAEVLNGREAIVLQCDHPRTTEMVGDRPDFRIELAADRETGVILRLAESMDGVTTRHAQVIEIAPDAPLAPSTFQFVFPTGTTMLY
ncbi:MAG TPA: hypothetical protein VF902_08805 [Coriobacteriia bacterium]